MTAQWWRDLGNTGRGVVWPLRVLMGPATGANQASQYQTNWAGLSLDAPRGVNQALSAEPGWFERFRNWCKPGLNTGFPNMASQYQANGAGLSLDAPRVVGPAQKNRPCTWCEAGIES